MRDKGFSLFSSSSKESGRRRGCTDQSLETRPRRHSSNDSIFVLRRKSTDDYADEDPDGPWTGVTSRSLEDLMQSGALPKKHSVWRYSSWTIRQHNLFRRCWDIFLGFVIIYVATGLPFKIAFIDLAESISPDAKYDVKLPQWDMLEMVINGFFIADLVLNFFFSYRTPSGREVVDVRKTACKYLKGSFALDFVASLPDFVVDWIVQRIIHVTNRTEEMKGQAAVNQAAKLARMQKATKLVRLVRLSRLVKVISYLNESEVWVWLNNLRSVRMLKIAVFMLVCVHICACLWYAVVGFKLGSFGHTWEQSWIGSRTLRDGSSLYETALGDPMLSWMTSVYFVTTVITTVGYGDIAPGDELEIVTVLFLMVLGIFLNSSIMSQALGVASSADRRAKDVEMQTKLIMQFAEQTEITRRTCQQLTDAVALRGGVESYDRREMQELFMCGTFPRGMLEHVAREVFGGSLVRNRFIQVVQGVYRDLPVRFALTLALVCQERLFDEKEVVFYYHDHAWNIFMVHKGIFAGVALPNRRGGVTAMTPASMAAMSSQKRTVDRQANGSSVAGKVTFEDGRGPSEKRSLRTTLQRSITSVATRLRVQTSSMYDKPSLAGRTTASSTSRVLRQPTQETAMTYMETYMETTIGGGAGDSRLSPYTIYAEGSFFGDAEILLNSGQPRKSCVRCETGPSGSLLVVFKDDLFKIMQEYRHCTEAWRSASRRNEERRRRHLQQCTSKISIEELAAAIIQKGWKYFRRPMAPKSLSVSREIHSKKGSKSTFSERLTVLTSKKVRRPIEEVPTYAQRLHQDVESLKGEVSGVKVRLRDEMASMHQALTGLRQQVERVVNRPPPAESSDGVREAPVARPGGKALAFPEVPHEVGDHEELMPHLSGIPEARKLPRTIGLGPVA